MMALNLVPVAPAAPAGLVPQTFDEAVRLAKAMASAKLVPDHLRDDPGSCLLIVEQAMRWGMSPMAVAQATSVVYGRLMFEGKLVAAAVNASGALATRFRYDYTGQGDTRTCTVSARLRGEEADRTIQVVLQDVRTYEKSGKPNRQWTGGQVDQQLSYAGVRAWARRHTPEVLLGVYSPEEMDEPAAARDQPPHSGPTLEAEAEPPTRRDEINREVPIEPKQAGRGMTWGEWIADLEARCASAENEDLANAILTEERVIRLDDPELAIRPELRQRALAIRQAMVDRIWPREPEEPEPEL